MNNEQIMEKKISAKSENYQVEKVLSELMERTLKMENELMILRN